MPSAAKARAPLGHAMNCWLPDHEIEAVAPAFGINSAFGAHFEQGVLTGMQRDLAEACADARGEGPLSQRRKGAPLAHFLELAPFERNDTYGGRSEGPEQKSEACNEPQRTHVHDARS